MKKEYAVYEYVNVINGKRYIGVTKNIHNRKIDHKRYANDVKRRERSLFHTNLFEYGIDNFEINILEYCDKNNKDEREKYYIQKYKSNNYLYGYNMTRGGIGGKTHDIRGENNPMYGKKLTNEHKEKMSKSLKGKPKPNGFGLKISNHHKGKTKSESHKKNISIALKKYHKNKKATESQESIESDHTS